MATTKTLSVPRAILAATKAYEAHVDREGLKIARLAWKEAREEIGVRQTSGMSRHNAEAVAKRARSLIMEWSQRGASRSPIVKKVENFVGTMREPNRRHVAFVILGSGTFFHRDPPYEVAQSSMRADIETDALAYIGGILEQALKK